MYISRKLGDTTFTWDTNENLGGGGNGDWMVVVIALSIVVIFGLLVWAFCIM